MGEAVAERAAGGGSGILVVDDDHDVTDVLATALELEGHRVRVAHDGYEGLRLLRDELPAAILLDVEMPRLNGPDMVYRMIVEDAGMERIPVVLVSGVIDLPSVARRVGTPYCLIKPFGLEDLRDLLRRALAERRAPTPRWEA